MTIKLDLHTLLPKTRAAYDAGQLQAQVAPSGRCLYNGPCAVGVGIAKARRKGLDKHEGGSEIDTLVEAGIIVLPASQINDITTLQQAHDGWSSASSSSDQEECKEYFETILG